MANSPGEQILQDRTRLENRIAELEADKRDLEAEVDARAADIGTLLAAAGPWLEERGFDLTGIRARVSERLRVKP